MILQENENTCARDEIKAMIRIAQKVGRHGVRDSALVLMMFR